MRRPSWRPAGSPWASPPRWGPERGPGAATRREEREMGVTRKPAGAAGAASPVGAREEMGVGAAAAGIGGVFTGPAGAITALPPELFLQPATMPVATPVVIADNSKFIDRVDLHELGDILVKPTKSVVISQNPAAGEQV